MPERQSSRLVGGALVQVHDVVCRAARSGYAGAEFTTTPQIALPRRGVFVVHRRGAPLVVDTNTALVLGLDEEYRVSHPGGGGDDCTVLILPPDVLEHVAGGVATRIGSLRPLDHFAVCLVTRALRDPAAEQIELEDAVLLLLGSLSVAFGQTAIQEPALSPAQRLRVEEGRALLASSPGARWDLSTLGRALYCSPFHLARQFRLATGETISRYLLRLRLGLAVDRLAEGESDLAALAVQSGFSQHSHFSSRFRGVFGLPPSRAREILTKRSLSDLKKLLTEHVPDSGRVERAVPSMLWL